MSVDIRDHGGIFGGGFKPLKYPIKYRVVGDTGVKRGDNLVMNSQGQLLPLTSQQKNVDKPIIPQSLDTGISSSPLYENSFNVLKFSSFYLLVQYNNGALRMRFMYFDKNKLSNVSSDFVLKSVTVNYANGMGFVKLSETKVLIMYRVDESASSIKVYGMIVDISNQSNPIVVTDSVVATYSSSNTTYRFDKPNVFTKQNGTVRVFYLGAQDYGGGKLLYLDITNNMSTISVLSNYSGTLPSNLSNYARNSKMLIYQEDASTTYTYLAVKSYVNSYTGWLYRFSINHDTNSFTVLPIQGTMTTEAGLSVLSSYGYMDNMLLSSDKTYIMYYYGYDNTSSDYGLMCFKVPILADFTIGSTTSIKFGLFGPVTLGNLNGGVMHELGNGKILMVFAAHDGTIYREYFVVLDSTIIGSTRATYYIGNLSYNYDTTGRVIRESTYNEFLHICYDKNNPTNLRYRFIDFDYISVNAIAKEDGAPGQLIQVYQPTYNH